MLTILIILLSIVVAILLGCFALKALLMWDQRDEL